MKKGNTGVIIDYAYFTGINNMLNNHFTILTHLCVSNIIENLVSILVETAT